MTKLSAGVVHELPADIQKHIIVTTHLQSLWEGLTPLGRNEYICWIISAKKTETRLKRIEWMCSDLEKGKRRPCCWAGCSHRNKQ